MDLSKVNLSGMTPGPFADLDDPFPNKDGISSSVFMNFGDQNVLAVPKQVMDYVVFENADNPTERDLLTVARPGVRDSFELKDGKIRPKYVPIRDKVKEPTGRSDYGWDHEMRRKYLTAAYARGWKEFPYRFRAHDGILHIVGGGPSLRGCIKQLRRYSEKPKNFILALNKSHNFLHDLPKHKLGPPIKVWGASLLDPCDWVKDYIAPRPGVQYFIGDQCAPATFDVFEKPGLTKWIYRATNPNKDKDIVPQTMHYVFGGSTVGLRMRTMGMMMGFREIHFWGFDSSCDTSVDPKGKLHAYEKVDSVKDRISIKILDEDGYEKEFISNTHMARQAQEYIEIRDIMIAHFKAGRQEWLKDVFHGEGLLPTIAARMGLHADRNVNCTENMGPLIPGAPVFSQTPGVSPWR